MIIYAVSPTHLDSLRIESEGYRFKLQGYGSWEAGMGGLVKTNAIDLYGFVIMVPNTAQHKEEIKKLILRFNIVSEGSKSKKRLVIAVEDDKEIIDLIRFLKPDNLEVFVARYEVVTDTFIRKEIYGTILTAHLTPYNGPKEKIEREVEAIHPLLKYIPVFGPEFMLAIEPVNLKGTIEDTELEDKVMAELSLSNEVFYTALRKFGIRKEFFSDLVVDKGIESLIEKEEHPVKKLQYTIFYDYVRTRGLNGVEGIDTGRTYITSGSR